MQISNSTACRSFFNLLVISSLISLPAKADWPQFRGPDAIGVSAKSKLPENFDKDSNANIAWLKKLPGRSVGGVIVVGDQIITTSSDGVDQRRIRLYSLNAKDGGIRWEQQFVARGRPFCHPTSSNAAPTPVSDGKFVYAFYSSNDLACVDLNGDLVWYRSLTTDFPKAANDVGMSSSPVVSDGVVIVQIECQGDSFVAGIDAADGTLRWRIDRPKKANWASPTSAKLPNGQNAVIIQSGDDVQALSPKDGKQIWRMNIPCSAIPSTAVVGTKLLVPSKGLSAFDLSSSGEPSPIWDNNKLSSNACSPVVVGRKVFTVSRTVLVCGDLFNGDVLWQLRLPDAKQIWSSPVVAGDRLYLFTMEGACYVVSIDGDEGRIVQTNQLGEEVLGSPAIEGDAMYVRSVSSVWKIGK